MIDPLCWIPGCTRPHEPGRRLCAAHHKRQVRKKGSTLPVVVKGDAGLRLQRAAIRYSDRRDEKAMGLLRKAAVAFVASMNRQGVERRRILDSAGLLVLEDMPKARSARPR